MTRRLGHQLLAIGLVSNLLSIGCGKTWNAAQANSYPYDVSGVRRSTNVFDTISYQSTDPLYNNFHYYILGVGSTFTGYVGCNFPPLHGGWLDTVYDGPLYFWESDYESTSSTTAAPFIRVVVQTSADGYYHISQSRTTDNYGVDGPINGMYDHRNDWSFYQFSPVILYGPISKAAYMFYGNAQCQQIFSYFHAIANGYGLAQATDPRASGNSSTPYWLNVTTTVDSNFNFELSSANN